MFHGPEVVVNIVLVAVFLMGGTRASADDGPSIGAAAAIQHRRVAELAGDHLDYRAGGPAVVVTARSAGPSPMSGRVQWASTRQSDGGDSWTGRIEAERRQAWGPFYAGSRISLGGEGMRHDPEAGLTFAEASWAPIAGMKLHAGPAKVRVALGIPAIGGMVRPGCTKLAPDLLDATPTLAEKAEIPAAIYVTGPWNHPAIDVTGKARWQLDSGEAWVAVRTTVERADIGHLERKMMTIQPELGWSWGGRAEREEDMREDAVPVLDLLVPVPVEDPVGAEDPHGAEEALEPPVEEPAAEAPPPSPAVDAPAPAPEPAGEAPPPADQDPI